MDKEASKKLTLPDAPGVYFFLGENKDILYIGKATSLRSRVRSYFTDDLAEKRSELIRKMVDEATTVEWTETDSVLEAMILEVNLIRTHKPRFNTRSKDDKSYNHVIITKEEWPRVLVVRGKDLTEKFSDKEIAVSFGPFPNSQLLREALKIIRKIFKFYDTKKPLGTETSKVTKGKIDFNRQIGLYPGDENREQYLRTIRHLRLFFSGKKKQLIKELERDMMRFAKAEQFEEAQHAKKQIFALEHIRDVSLLKQDARHYRDDRNFRIEAYDVAHMQGQDMVGVMTVVENGVTVPSEYRKFKIRNYQSANDPGALQEIIERRLKREEWPLAQLIVADGNDIQKRVIESELQKTGKTIPVVGVVKDERHKPKALIGSPELIAQNKELILLANSEAHRFAITYHKAKRRKSFLD